jgi:ribonuclease BN (tRNA processing enzyme)
MILIARKANVGELLLRHSVERQRQVLLAIVCND